MNAASRASSSSRGLFTEVVRWQQAGRRGALATPLWFSGSVPLRRQSRLLLCDDGTFSGTVGGGALEARVLEAAREVIAAGEARVLEFDLAGEEAARAGMICGGQCAVLIEPVVPGEGEEAYALAARAEAEGAPLVLITVLQPEGGVRKLVMTPAGDWPVGPEEAALAAALRPLAEQALRAEQPQYVTEPVRAYVEPILPAPRVVIFGAGHIGAVLAHLAAVAGFRVVVVDDREEFANPDRFPTADEVLALSVPEAFARLRVGSDSYLVSVTRGHAHDEEVMALGLSTPARYLGMIGSRRKVAAIFERLRERGFGDADLARIHAPIGLKIGAETVEEIAVSILAQLIAARRGVA